MFLKHGFHDIVLGVSFIHHLPGMYAGICDRCVITVVQVHGKGYLVLVSSMGSHEYCLGGGLCSLLPLRIPSHSTDHSPGKISCLYIVRCIKTCDRCCSCNVVGCIMVKIEGRDHPAKNRLAVILVTGEPLADN